MVHRNLSLLLGEKFDQRPPFQVLGQKRPSAKVVSKFWDKRPLRLQGLFCRRHCSGPNPTGNHDWTAPSAVGFRRQNGTTVRRTDLPKADIDHDCGCHRQPF